MSSRAWLLAVVSVGVIAGACSAESGGQCLDANGYPLNPQPDLPGCRLSGSAGSGPVSSGAGGSTQGAAGSGIGTGGTVNIGGAVSTGGVFGGAGASAAGSAGFIGVPEAGMGGEPSFEAGAGGATGEAGAGGVHHH